MGIREDEDKLFEKWKKDYEDESFVIDGCPNPSFYSQEDRKVVFILKDGNLGKPKPDDKVYDQRNELENEPTPWWATISRWCYFLKNPSGSWRSSCNVITDKGLKSGVQKEELKVAIRDALKYHCIIQLKKTWGKGKVTNKELYQFIKSDREYILSQLGVYTPDFIIACGNGDQISTLFDVNKKNRLETDKGVGYWKIELMEKPCYLVDYCHPSIRCGTKVKGLIAKGLSEAILEIEKER